MNNEIIILIVQIIAALGVVVSVVYLGIQIHQQNEITKAQFGHSLTQRQYERYFASSKDGEFSEFLSKDWSGELSDRERVRVTMFLITTLVDIFDVYEKVENNFVDKKHLEVRMNAFIRTSRCFLSTKLFSTFSYTSNISTRVVIKNIVTLTLSLSDSSPDQSFDKNSLNSPSLDEAKYLSYCLCVRE